MELLTPLWTYLPANTLGMGRRVRIEHEVPGLAGALALRGIHVDPAALAVVTARWPTSVSACGPVILLVPHPDQAVAALDAGADDAVAMGAGAEEIAARIAARLRAAAAPIAVGELVIDRVARRVTRAGHVLALLPREYALLLHLAQRAGQAVSRHELLEAVWGLRFHPGTNVLAVHISRLRAKLDRGFAGPMLRTEPGIGYRLAPA
jgi:two-component system, OmpR family, response regulator